MWMGVCIYVCTTCMHCPFRRPEEPWNPLSWSCRYFFPPCRCWEADQGPLQEHQVLLDSELFLQPPRLSWIGFFVDWCFRSGFLHCSSLVVSVIAMVALRWLSASVCTSSACRALHSLGFYSRRIFLFKFLYLWFVFIIRTHLLAFCSGLLSTVVAILVFKYIVWGLVIKNPGS